MRSTRLISILSLTLSCSRATLASPLSIASSYNALFYYDSESITNPTFVEDAMNATTLALAAAIHDQTNIDEALDWSSLYDHAETTLGNIGWVLQSEVEDSVPQCYNEGGVDLLEVIAAA